MSSKYTVKLTRVSKYSYTITIPKDLVGKYGWREKQKITVKDLGRGKIEISDWRKQSK